MAREDRMTNRIHFIADPPRAGSTSLPASPTQNPRLWSFVDFSAPPCFGSGGRQFHDPRPRRE
jgi:hypothetical protein